MNTNCRIFRGLAGGLPALALTAALLALAVPAWSVPQIMTPYGDQLGWTGAEVNSMGGTGTALFRGGYSNIFNPALLADATGYRFDGGVSLDQQHEDRFQPLFDGFESYIRDVAIASNREHYFQTGFALSGIFGPDDRPVAAALSLTDRYAFNYTFEEELRNPSPYIPAAGEPARDQIIEERRREIDGTVRDLSVGVGYQVHERISVGASAHYAFGTRTEVNTVRDLATATNSYDYRDEFDLSGVNFTVGLRGKVNDRLELALAWDSALEAEGDWTSDDYEAETGETTSGMVDGSFKYPQAYRAGMAFRPRTDPRTVFTMELEYKPWSELEDFRVPGDDNPQNLDDTMDVRIGLEHLFYNGMPLRFGFRHFDSYADKESSASVFSAGVGAPLGSGMVSVSLELSKISSIQAHQFPYPTNYFGDSFVADPMARVDDTRFRVGAGYTVGF
ncbi:MAG: hypothetical protein ABIK96_06395 [bacterium]